MIFEVILLLLAIPAGYLIAWMARDELVSGRKYFVSIIIAALIIGGWFLLTGQAYITYTSTFLLVITLIAYTKSFDPHWTK